MREHPSRRQALGMVGALAATAVTRAPAFSRDANRRVVIDAQGALLDRGATAGAIGTASPGLLDDAARSGLSAIAMTMGPVGDGPGRYAATLRDIAKMTALCDAHPDRLFIVRSGADIRDAKANGRLGLILDVQDTVCLEGDTSRIAALKQAGLGMLQLTYNLHNRCGDGCLTPHDAGLSAFGRDVVAETERQRIVLDLSHGGARTIVEAIATSTRPLAISHSGCRALADRPRNVDDAILRAVARGGGVVGIYLMPFLREAGQPHAADVIAHLEHAVRVCGEDHVGIGTDGILPGITIDTAYRALQRDFYERRRAAGVAAPGEAADVFNLVPDYNTPDRFATIAHDLTRRGWPARRIEKILGGNFLRLFGDCWGA